jgi:hypothetical protein
MLKLWSILQKQEPKNVVTALNMSSQYSLNNIYNLKLSFDVPLHTVPLRIFMLLTVWVLTYHAVSKAYFSKESHGLGFYFSVP